jgi:hypothetical protein
MARALQTSSSMPSFRVDAGPFPEKSSGKKGKAPTLVDRRARFVMAFAVGKGSPA